MQATTRQGSAISVSSRTTARSGTHPIVTSRKTAAALLTACAVAMGVGFAAFFGAAGFAAYAVGLPVGLFVLWHSADTLRSDEEPREQE